MTQRLWPADDVFLARVDADMVILRVAADVYECLPGAGSWILLEPNGALAISDADLAEALADASIAVRDRPDLPRRCPTPPRSELVPEGPPSRTDAVRSLVGLARDTLAFQGKPLGALVREAGAGLAAPPADPAAGLAVVAAAFQHALPWVPFEGECLQRGFQLKRALARQGIGCDWVFGVRTWPFGAHCWIQRDDVVVCDTLAHVSAYTPIMVA